MTVGHLARVLPEQEFSEWQRYAARRLLPLRRIELGLAQIAMLIDVQMGGAGPDVRLRDYLFSELEEDAEDSGDPEDIEARMVEDFGFRPTNIKD